jgi:di/tricarboxylate transporter
MALFIVSGVLNPEEGFSGFNHPATITLGCMFVVSGAVFRSGLIDGLSSTIVKVAKIHFLIALIVFCFISALFSAFVNDSAVVAILIPMVLSVCREAKIAPSKLLIPVSFAALFGGTCTLIGTSTNILVSSIAEKSGLEPFGMFEFTLPALCLMGIGFVYLFLLAPILLPNRTNQNTKEITLEQYSAEIILKKGNKDIQKSIEKSAITEKYGATIVSIIRNGEPISTFDRDTILEENDILKVILSPKKLGQLKSDPSYNLSGDKKLDSHNNSPKKLFETLIPIGSSLAGQSLKQANFRNVYNCSVLAVRHREELVQENISELTLRAGDLLIVYATEEEIHDLVDQKIVIILSERKVKKINYRKAIPALIIAVGVVMFAAFEVTSILISSMVGCLLLVTTSTIKPKEAYESIEWKVIFMMAGVLSMGTALEKTGGDKIISEFVFENLGAFDPRITLSLIFLITFLSTNILSSKATAALMVPIVLSLATAMQISEKPFLIAVMFACSLTFMTPVSYPTNTMVYSAGNYKFIDFLKIGTPLNIIIWIAASFIIPFFFPF